MPLASQGFPVALARWLARAVQSASAEAFASVLFRPSASPTSRVDPPKRKNQTSVAAQTQSCHLDFDSPPRNLISSDHARSEMDGSDPYSQYGGAGGSAHQGQGYGQQQSYNNNNYMNGGQQQYAMPMAMNAGMDMAGGAAASPMYNSYQNQQPQFHQGGGGGGGGYGSPYGSPYRGRGRGRGGPRRSGGGGGGHGGWGMTAEQDRQKQEEERARRVRERLFKIADTTPEEEEFYPQSDLFTLKKWIEEEAAKGHTQNETILKAFRVMVTEQPHKTPLIAALLGFLIISPGSSSAAPANGDESAADELPASLGIRIAKDLVQAFRSHVHAREWRNIRLSLHFFAALVPLGIVQPSSLRHLLSSFAMVLNEPFVTVDRGDRAALCIIETLCRSGSHLLRPDTGSSSADTVDAAALEDLNSLTDTVESYAKNRRTGSNLKRPWRPLAEGEEQSDTLHEEGFEHAVAAMAILRAREYRPAAFLPVATDLLPPAIVTMVQSILNGSTDLRQEQYSVTMPEILVPPEEDEYEGASFNFGSDPLKSGSGLGSKGKRGGAGGGKHKAITLAKDEEEVKRAGTGPEKQALYARWFTDSTPLVGTPSAVVLRSLVLEIVDLYEVNRRESARILFNLPKFLRKGTFVGKAVSPDTGFFGDADDLAWIDEDEQDPQGGWILDDVLVESILAASFVLPIAPHVPLYYHALLREVTTLSPQTLAPAIGRTVRKIYGCSKTGRVSTDVLKRFADWFSVHLSNFNFSWGWKEWIPDMELCHSHPAKSVARRIVELENRLAYYDRIKSTLPEEVASNVLRPEEPTPCFTYEAEDHPYHARAATLGASLRARATAPVVLAELESLKRDLIQSDSAIPEEDSLGKVATEAEAEIIVRDIVIQVVLNIGSRSFSHFLNIVERYHGLLRQLSSSPSMRSAILASTTRFWARSAQWVIIVLDKLMQYRIVEPADVINFIFYPPAASTVPETILQGSGDGVPASFSKLLEATGKQGACRDWASFDWYEIVRMTIEKVNGRVGQVRRRLARLQREEAEEAERKEAAAAAGVAEDDAEAATGGGGGDSPTSAVKVPFSFPTSASLPPRPAAAAAAAPAPTPTAETETKRKEEEDQRKQTVEEARSSLDSILSEQRKVLAGAFRGLAESFTRMQNGIDSTSEESEWRAWWAREWYLAYLRQFNKDFVTMQETLSAVVVGQGQEGSEWKVLFEEACKLAYE
ncbi:unnamed protein product [Sympodiomycopsis kandeliae]